MKRILIIITLGIASTPCFSQDAFSKLKNKAATEVSTAKTAAETDAAKAQGAATSGAGTATKTMPSLPAMGDISSLKESIMAKLTPSLSLTDKQKPAVTDAIGNFLKSKASITPLAATNKPAYTSKLSTLKSGMLAKVKKAVTSAQYAKFLKLKPKTTDAANVLSNLFN